MSPSLITVEQRVQLLANGQTYAARHAGDPLPVVWLFAPDVHACLKVLADLRQQVMGERLPRWSERRLKSHLSKERRSNESEPWLSARMTNAAGGTLC
ncbi:DUF2958 domain-containing protein [Cupriavidus sp. IDO]|uniref:DUF2958 domain-containing protein n=1 Tax=Cupriavidus sp. IDO TaxID=1539142 RepID=UPI0009E47E5D